MYTLLLFCLLVFLLSPLTRADLNLTELESSILYRMLGPEDQCPETIEFLPVPLECPKCKVTYPADKILFNGKPIQSDPITFEPNRTGLERSGYPRVLKLERDVFGTFFSALATSDIKWDSAFPFTEGSALVMFKPNGTIGLAWTEVVGPDEATDPDKLAPIVKDAPLDMSYGYANSDGAGIYLVLNHRCLMRKKPSFTCFPAHAMVGDKRMDELRLGDSVWTGQEYSDVFAFTHRENRWEMFLVISLTGEVQLPVTHGHYVFANNRCVKAADVKIGDWMRTKDGARRVVAIHEERLWGVYNPQTENGLLMVNGVSVSAYTDAVEKITHTTWWGSGHAFLTPVRALWALWKLVSGVMSR